MSFVQCGPWTYFGPDSDEARANAEEIFPLEPTYEFPEGCEHLVFETSDWGHGLYARHLAYDNEHARYYTQNDVPLRDCVEHGEYDR